MYRIIACFTLLLLAFPAFSDSLFDGAPELELKFDDYKKAQGAVLMGKVKQVDSSPEVPDTVTFHDNIEYAAPDGVSLTLDMYIPKNAKTPPPVLVFIHGGAWRSGKKEDAAPYTVPFADLGYATVAIQYRLLPDHQYPKAIQDVNAAIAWLRANNTKYGFNGDRMALLGGSAGGHLAMLAGYSQDPALGSSSKRVDAIVNLYGVTDCTTPIAIAEQRVIKFMGTKYENDPAPFESASPILHLDKLDPPTITFHGTIDELVPVAQADRLHEKLNELGIPNYYDRIEGWPHSMDVAQPVYDRCAYIVKKFLAKHLPLEK